MNPGGDSTPSTLEPFRAVLAPSVPPCATSCHTPGHPAPSLGLVLVKDTGLYHNPDIIPALRWENKEEIPIPAPRLTRAYSSLAMIHCIPLGIVGTDWAVVWLFQL